MSRSRRQMGWSFCGPRPCLADLMGLARRNVVEFSAEAAVWLLLLSMSLSSAVCVVLHPRLHQPARLELCGDLQTPRNQSRQQSCPIRNVGGPIWRIAVVMSRHPCLFGETVCPCRSLSACTRGS